MKSRAAAYSSRCSWLAEWHFMPVRAAFWELGLAQGFTAEVIRQHVLLKVHDKSIWQSCLHKLSPVSGSAGSHYQLILHALGLLAAEQKLSQGFQDQSKTDARKTCQINGAGSKLDNIIWATPNTIFFLILFAICNYKSKNSLKTPLYFHFKRRFLDLIV